MSAPERLVALLAERYGFADTVLTESALTRALAAVPGDAAAVLADPALADAVAAHLCVSETWFCRDRGAFVAAAAQAQACRQRRPATPVRVLCAGCATGEEAYSAVFTLHEAGLPLAAISIEAFDLSAPALTKAATATYTDYSFRQCPDGFRTRWFTDTAEGWTVRPEYRQRVRFRAGNLLAPPVAAGTFDLVFCRNVFLYLHAQARAQARQTLSALLAPDGILLAGAAETGMVWAPDLVPAGTPEQFSFRRAVAAPAAAAPVTPAAARPAAAPRPAALPPLAGPVTVTAVPDTGVAPTLDAAQACADRGDLQRAAALCDALLQQEATPGVLYLRGMLHQAQREDDAAQRCFAQAVYLDPRHAAALQALALQRAAAGAHASAARLRAQAARTAGEAR